MRDDLEKLVWGGEAEPTRADVEEAVQMAYEIGYREGSQDAVRCDCGKPRIIGWCSGPCDKDE